MSDTCTAFSVVPDGFEAQPADCHDTVQHVVITKCDCHPNLYLCDRHFSLYLDRGWITEPWMGVVDEDPESIAAVEEEIRNSPGPMENGSMD